MSNVTNVRRIIQRVNELEIKSWGVLRTIKKEIANNPEVNLSYLIQHKSETLVINELLQYRLKILLTKMQERIDLYQSFPLTGAVTGTEEQSYQWFVSWLDTHLVDCTGKVLEKIETSAGVGANTSIAHILVFTFQLKGYLQLVGIYKALREMLISEEL